MIVRTTAARGDERIELSGEGPDYESAKAALAVPDGWHMLFIGIDR